MAIHSQLLYAIQGHSTTFITLSTLPYSYYNRSLKGQICFSSDALSGRDMGYGLDTTIFMTFCYAMMMT